jgi:hypothetical protein
MLRSAQKKRQAERFAISQVILSLEECKQTSGHQRLKPQFLPFIGTTEVVPFPNSTTATLRPRLYDPAPALKRWVELFCPSRGVARGKPWPARSKNPNFDENSSKIRILTKTLVYRNPIVLAELV